MKQLARRVGSLEVKSGVGGWDIYKTTHLIWRSETEDELSGLRGYRAANPEKVVGPDDNVIWPIGVAPKFDADGNRVFRKAADDEELAKRGGRPLVDLLAELGEV